MEVRPSAHKHGISDDNIRHAINNAIAAITRPEQPDFTMLIGPDTAAHYVIHAMAARSKYLTMIDPPRGEQQ